MSRAYQPLLPTFKFSSKLSLGGIQTGGRGKNRRRLTGNPTTARPVDTKRALHIVLKSSVAVGENSFLRHNARIQGILDRQAKLFGLKLYDAANAGNHLHLIVRTPSRRALANFLRAVSGLVARVALHSERGSAWARGKLKGFWDVRPFSRIVSWGRDYDGLKNYLMVNRIEMLGMDRLSTRQMLARLREYQRRGLLAPTGFA